MNYFLDTDTCIFIMDDTFPTVIQRLTRHSPAHIKIPAVVKAELLFGAHRSSKPEQTLSFVQQWLEPFDVVPFDDPCTAIQARVRHELAKAGHMIGANDLFIAAIVLRHHGTLVTRDVKEFRRIPELLVDDWMAG